MRSKIFIRVITLIAFSIAMFSISLSSRGFQGVAGQNSNLNVVDRNGIKIGQFISYSSSNSRIVLSKESEIWEIDLTSGQIVTANPLYSQSDCSGDSFLTGVIADSVFVSGRTGSLIKVSRSEPITITSPYVWFRGTCQSLDSDLGTQFIRVIAYSGPRPNFLLPLRISR